MRTQPHTRLIFWLLTVALLLAGAASILRRQAPAPQAATGPLRISELMASNGQSLPDEDGDFPDWIELHNAGSQPVNLSGFSLTDDPARPQKWSFPNLTLNADDYLVVFASGKNRAVPNAPLHTNFKLRKDGEFLGLYSLLEARFVDEIGPVYPPQQRDVAFDPVDGYHPSASPGGENGASPALDGTAAPVQFSQTRGFYDTPFTVKLTSDTKNANIRYTLDGSEPTATGGLPYSAPIPVERTTLLRAAAFKDGLLPAPVTTHSYIFPDNVINQPADPSGWPGSWGVYLDYRPYQPPKGDPVPADYRMDPRITQDERFGPLVAEGLTALPSLSIVTAPENFDIYVNALERGLEWERPVSLEWLDPINPEREFQVNAGIRMQGVSARWEFMPKKSFRLFFRGEYGRPTLQAPLFPGSPVTAFNALVLRGGANRSYAGFPADVDYTQVTYARDEWLRASQIEMSGVGAHGTFVHLYLNGLYWGLYNLVERPDLSFAAAYYGGQPADWFGAKHGGTVLNPKAVAQGADPVVEMGEALGGDDTRYRRILSLLDEGNLADPARYAEMAQLVDIEQFADYIILNLYAGNNDWGDNNWFIAMRNTPPSPLRYFVWDGEVTWNEGARLYLGKSGEHHKMRQLFLALLENPDFRLAFADRVYTQLHHNGALTDANSLARWERITQPLASAIAAESARWGDVRYSDDPVGPDDWQRAVANVRQQMEGNGDKLLRLLRKANYYPALDPPVFSQHGGQIEPGFALKMSASAGDIYFTTGGNDPRTSVTDGPASVAIHYAKTIALTETTQIKARAVANGEWSALAEATFYVDDVEPGQAQITEIMYNPANGSDFEYLRLTNIGGSPVNLSGFSFEGIRYQFPPNTPLLPPGESIVLARNATALAEQQPDVPIFGAFGGQLANSGETLRLRTADGSLATEVTFSDDNGWPVTADGRGDSLIFINPQGDPNNPKNWRGSSQSSEYR